MSIWGDIRRRAENKSIRKEDEVSFPPYIGFKGDVKLSSSPEHTVGDIYILSEDCDLGRKGQMIVATNSGWETIGYTVDGVDLTSTSNDMAETYKGTTGYGI